MCRRMQDLPQRVLREENIVALNYAGGRGPVFSKSGRVSVRGAARSQRK